MWGSKRVTPWAVPTFVFTIAVFPSRPAPNSCELWCLVSARFPTVIMVGIIWTFFLRLIQVKVAVLECELLILEEGVW